MSGNGLIKHCCSNKRRTTKIYNFTIFIKTHRRMQREGGGEKGSRSISFKTLKKVSILKKQ